MSLRRRPSWASGLALGLHLGLVCAGAASAGELRAAVGRSTAPAGAETDVAYVGAGTLRLGAEALRLEGSRLLRASGAALVLGLRFDPVADGAHLCAADEGEDGLGRLRCWDAAFRATTVVLGGRPGRLALSGAVVAYVASPEGLPQVTVARVDGAAPPRPLTNVGLQRVVGQAPLGFVPPPLGRSLRFDGAWLRWDSPTGPQSVRWGEPG